MNVSVFLPICENAFALVYLRDVVGDGQRAVGARALGVHDALGDALAVQVRKLLDQVEILQQHRAARAGGERILIVGDGNAAAVVSVGRLAMGLLTPVM